MTDSRDKETIQRLILFGLLYNAAEGLLCVWAGVAAGSVVLIGFGLDSGIEAWAAFAAWRFLQKEITEKTEERLSGFIGWTFLVLAGYVIIQSGHDLLEGVEVARSRLGLVVTSVSLLVMPLLGWWKLRLARRLGSRGLEAEAKETIACSYLSFFAVLGVAIRYVGGPSWVDSVAALLMVPWLVREGLEGIRGEVSEEPHGHR